MERITGSAVSVDLFGAGKDGFKDGDKANGIPATIVTAEFLNSIQEEVANVIEGAGITLDVNNRTQLKQAISVMLAGANTIARFTTTGNITLSGLATQGGGDWGGALTAGDVVLVKNQSTASQNGWYAAAAGAWTRVVYLDESEEVKPSTLTKVSEGATLADTLWMLTTDAPITVGSTNLVFGQKGVNDFSVDAGQLVITTDSTAPPGTIKANGAAISRTTYSALFAKYGTTYGAGDGSTTFNIPDFRGEFFRAWDDGRGIDAGRVNGSQQNGSVHSFDIGLSAAVLGDRVQGVSDPFVAKQQLGYDNAIAGDYGAAAGFYVAAANLGGSIANSTESAFGAMRPRNIAVLVCIKY